MLALQCCLALLSGAAAAQDVLSCDSGMEIARERLPRLAAHQPGPSQLAALKKARHRRFGPFDRATNGFTSVDIYLRVPRTSPDSIDGEYGPAEIVVRLGSPTPRWFKVVPSVDQYADERMLFAHASIGADDSEPDAVRLATADPRVPIFVVQLGQDTGRGRMEWQHVLDLRPKRRRLPVAIHCVVLENQGTCGAWDAQYRGTSASGSCTWEPALGDFRCKLTEQVGVTWGERSAHIEQTLIDKGGLPPRSLDDVLQRLAAATPETLEAALAEVAQFTGPARLVLQRPLPDGGKWMLVGVGGRASIFDARFAVIRVEHGKAKAYDVIDVPLGPDSWLADRERSHPVSMLGGRVMAPALAMQGTIVFERPDLVVTQVHVREGEERPNGSTVGQAIYWVGVSVASSGPTASSLRLATDTYEYFNCTAAATPPNVLAWTMTPGDAFAAGLDIEPAHGVDLFSGEPGADADDSTGLESSACATKASVTWRDGFKVAHRDAPRSCGDDVPARFVRIDANGRIQLADRPGTAGRPQ